MDDAQPLPSLVLMAGSRACAIPVDRVVETMRPMPIEPIPNAAPFVLGLSIVRGAPVPVVALSQLVGARDAGRATRFVTVRAGDRVVALAVDRVEGVVALDRARLDALPPLLRDVSEAVAGALALDERLLLVLRAARLFPDGVSGAEP